MGRRAGAALGLVALLCCSACGHASAGAAAVTCTGLGATVAASAPTAYPLTITDDAGRSVTIPAEPQRIVSLTLGTDEMLFALVDASRVVAVTSLASDPTSSFVAGQVGGLPGLSANAEQVIALKPDLVFAASYTQAGVISQLTSAGIPVVEFTTFCSLANVEAHVQTMGRILNAPAAATQLVAQMSSEVAKVRAAVAGQRRPRVVFYSDGYLYGTGTTIDEVIADAGGTDAAAAAGFNQWTQVGPEEIVKLNPDVILTDGATSDDADQGGAAKAILTDPVYRGVKAVRSGQVWELSPRADSDVGQYMAWDVQDVAAVLHPAQIQLFTPPAG